MSTAVKKEKVEKDIAALPEAVRRRVNAIYHSDKAYRHGSQRYGKKHPASAVGDEQYKLMAICHYQCGMPFRSLERAFKLYPASGNGAQRCAIHGRKLIRKSGLPSWFKVKKAIKVKVKAKKQLVAA